MIKCASDMEHQSEIIPIRGPEAALYEALCDCVSRYGAELTVYQVAGTLQALIHEILSESL
jgi:hypothetical protein